ncbi:integrase/recombinase XerD [Catalinimonas alkaloidigena]|uniref:Integrase/recombinase XerD n=1 Tax=Catalinimonas alkaloidigena TaxID=1075417 RepID=A0A1G9U0Q7_9BACT|nr:site-specific integrase [Catalinimonas alkaloidigena]SDM53549.1 integrase/recombinase XerD [Catalinimonas alkaloidigena]
MSAVLTPASRDSHPLAPSHTKTLTTEQAISYFRATLKKPNNYLSIARRYVEFCQQHDYAIDPISLSLFIKGKAGRPLAASVASAARKFVRFCQEHGITRILPEDQQPKFADDLHEYVQAFLQHHSSLRGEKSAQTYSVGIRMFLEFLQERGLPFHGPTLKLFRNQASAEGKSAFTVNNYLSAVRQLAKWTLDNRDKYDFTAEQLDGLRDVASVKGLECNTKAYYKEPLTEAERQHLLATVTAPRAKAAIALMAYSGLRIVEVARLERSDVKEKEGIVMVLGKGKRTKQPVRLFDVAADALHDWMTEVEGKRLFDVSTDMLRKEINQWLRRADLKREGISAHSLRHTAAQVLIQKGVDPIYVQRQLRHAQFTTTQVYINKETEKQYLEALPTGM